jgi:hypothetical protein
MVVLGAPLLTVEGIENYGAFKSYLPLLGVVLLIGIYLPMLAWVSLWLSLKIRTKFRATLVILGIIFAWCVVPVIVAAVIGFSNSSDSWDGILLLSPAVGIILNEDAWTGLGNNWPPIVVMVLNFGFYGAILYGVRRACLRRADRYLRGETNAK